MENAIYLLLYRVPASNDKLEKGDILLEIKCTLVQLQMVGTKAFISIYFNNIHSSFLLRIKNIQALIQDIEKIAMNYFTENYNAQFFTLKIAE